MRDPMIVLTPGPRRGRPPRAEARSTCRVEIVVSPAERAELARVAAVEQKPIATVIRQAVNEYVADYRDARLFRR